MPLSSAEVAAQIGQYQQLHMSYAQQSGMIGNMLRMQGSSQQQSQDLAGGVINRAQAIGSPLMSFGMGLAGADPISLGMSAAGIGSRMGMGAIGAGMMGLGMGTGVGVLAAGAQYAGQQILTGAQQQQAFNSAMRQTFYQQTPWGQGFSTGQTNQIGAGIRHMAGDQGPAGEMSSFRELSSIALRMGQMGQMTGVRDVQEFGRKFKEMVGTLKTVAREMGTSLEAAQEFVGSMRGSGIFRASDQIKAAGMMRAGSISGGLAVSELSAMGNIGSQIARSVGGRGRSGMFAGIKTLTDVGNAVQAGVISEEDIYNATGLTGAEGRQAYATSQMSGAADFLRSGRGRWFMASVAGKNGTIDEKSASAWAGGQMGVGRTRGAAGAGLGRAGGRAGFLRNEGRLRGAALEQFGGNLPAMALNNWMSERGMDLTDMGDREMIFASRMLGMGMDSLEPALEQLKNQSKIKEHAKTSGREDAMLRSIADRRKTGGVEGIKRKFEQAREHVQGKLQQVGADLYTSVAEDIETSLNRLAGIYVDEADRHILSAYEAGKKGAGGASRSAFGIGGSTRGGWITQGRHGMNALGRSRAEAGAFANLNNGGFMNLGTSQLDKIKGAGYGDLFTSGSLNMRGMTRDQAVEARTRQAEAISMAAANQYSSDGATFGSRNGGTLQAEYLRLGLAGKGGLERITGFEQLLRERAKTTGKREDDERLQAFSKMSRSQQAAFVATMEEKAGMPKNMLLRDKAGMPESMQSGSFASRAEMSDAFVKGSRMGEGMSDRLGRVGAVWGVAVGTAAGPIGMALGGYAGSKVGGFLGNKIDEWAGNGLPKSTADAMSEFMMGEKGRDIMVGLMSADPGEQNAARSRVMEMGLEAGGSGNKAMEGSMKVFAAMDEYARAVEKNGGKHDTQLANQVAARHGVPGGGAVLRKTMGAAYDLIKTKQDMNVRVAARQVSTEAKRDLGAMMRNGSIREGERGYELSADTTSSLMKNLGGKDAQIVMGLMKVRAKEAALGSGTVDEQRRSMGDIQANTEDLLNMVSGRSIAQQRAIAGELRAAGMMDQAQSIEEGAGLEQRMGRAIRKGGAGVGAFKSFGLDLSRQERAAAASLWNKGRQAGAPGEDARERYTAMLAEKIGLGTPEQARMRAENIQDKFKTKYAGKDRSKMSALERYEADKEISSMQAELAEANKAAAISPEVQKAMAAYTKSGSAKDLRKLQEVASPLLDEAAKKKKDSEDSGKQIVKAIGDLPRAFGAAMASVTLKVTDAGSGGGGVDKPGGTATSDGK